MRRRRQAPALALLLPAAATAMDPVPPIGTCGIGEDHHDDGWGHVSVACPAGEVVAEVIFASWGDWSAECGDVKCTANKDQCNGQGCNGGASCACPCKGFTTTTCSSCSWSQGSCHGSHALDFVEAACLGKEKCGPFPANNGNEYDGKGKGDPCPGKAKHLGISVRCCPASGCPLLSQWGIQFLLCLVAGSAAYVGGGAAYGKRHGGGSGGRLIEAHPHFARWKEVEALAMDGLAYSRARMGGGGGRGAGYRRVSSAEVRKEGGAQPERKKEKQRKEKTPREKRESGKKDKKKEGKREERAEAKAPAPAPAAAASPAAATVASTASGGGGRWVHVPN